MTGQEEIYLPYLHLCWAGRMVVAAAATRLEELYRLRSSHPKRPEQKVPEVQKRYHLLC